MKCIHCNSEWNPNAGIASSLSTCPFCGKSLAKEEEPKFYENSKDALAAIMNKHGQDVLLGEKLKPYFSDYAPSVSRKIKIAINAVYETGAAKVLKSNLNASQADKEIAVKIAVRELTDNYPIGQDMAENIIYEFIDALGWQVEKLVAQKATPPVQTPPPNNGITITPKRGSTMPFGKYDWRVLEVDKQNNSALILSDKAIEKRAYNEKNAGVTWKSCTLRSYLNGAFYNTFSAEEKRRIKETRIVNSDNPWYSTKGGADTDDRIFLLSIEEAVKYFGDSGQLRNKNPKSEYYIDDQYNAARIAKDAYGEACWWWLRSPGSNSDFAAYVNADGDVDVLGNLVYSTYGGIRPALWLNL
jgi:hypothetical protein